MGRFLYQHDLACRSNLTVELQFTHAGIMRAHESVVHLVFFKNWLCLFGGGMWRGTGLWPWWTCLLLPQADLLPGPLSADWALLLRHAAVPGRLLGAHARSSSLRLQQVVSRELCSVWMFHSVIKKSPFPGFKTSSPFKISDFPPSFFFFL